MSTFVGVVSDVSPREPIWLARGTRPSLFPHRLYLKLSLTALDSHQIDIATNIFSQEKFLVFEFVSVSVRARIKLIKHSRNACKILRNNRTLSTFFLIASVVSLDMAYIAIGNEHALERIRKVASHPRNELFANVNANIDENVTAIPNTFGSSDKKRFFRIAGLTYVNFALQSNLNFIRHMPHGTPGNRDASSFIARVESQPEYYPPLIKLEDSAGLKITNNSFARALDILSSMG